MSLPFIGEIRIIPYNFAPLGWALCNGQRLPIAQYDALWSIIGTTYGGDGQVTFALPNLQGRTPAGFGQGPGLSNYAIGEQGGVESVTLTAANLPPHTHTLRASSTAATASTPDNNSVLA